VVKQLHGQVGLFILDALRRAGRHDGDDVPFERGRVLPAPPAVGRGGARAEADPLAVAPVGQVVARLAARLGPIRHLVLLVAGLGQSDARGGVHFGQLVVIGQDERAACHVATHGHLLV